MTIFPAVYLPFFGVLKYNRLQQKRRESYIMKDYKKIYEEWLANPYFDEATKEELRAIAGDENEIKERFYMDLEFGTAGLRGIIGAGINRMNIYVVRRATQGLANYIIKQGGQGKGVAIAYDSRRMSPEFADEALAIFQVLQCAFLIFYVF